MKSSEAPALLADTSFWYFRRHSLRSVPRLAPSLLTFPQLHSPPGIVSARYHHKSSHCSKQAFVAQRELLSKATCALSAEGGSLMLETRVMSAVCMTLKRSVSQVLVKKICFRLFFYGLSLDLACFQARPAQRH